MASRYKISDKHYFDASTVDTFIANSIGTISGLDSDQLTVSGGMVVAPTPFKVGTNTTMATILSHYNDKPVVYTNKTVHNLYGRRPTGYKYKGKEFCVPEMISYPVLSSSYSSSGLTIKDYGIHTLSSKATNDSLEGIYLDTTKLSDKPDIAVFLMLVGGGGGGAGGNISNSGGTSGDTAFSHGGGGGAFWYGAIDFGDTNCPKEFTIKVGTNGGGGSAGSWSNNGSRVTINSQGGDGGDGESSTLSAGSTTYITCGGGKGGKGGGSYVTSPSMSSGGKFSNSSLPSYIVTGGYSDGGDSLSSSSWGSWNFSRAQTRTIDSTFLSGFWIVGDSSTMSFEGVAGSKSSCGIGYQGGVFQSLSFPGGVGGPNQYGAGGAGGRCDNYNSDDNKNHGYTSSVLPTSGKAGKVGALIICTKFVWY